MKREALGKRKANPRLRTLCALLAASIAALALASCTTAPIRPTTAVKEYDIQLATQIPRVDICHVVAPGETVWRISKMYGVTVDDVMRANRLKTPQELEMGQRLIIPKALPYKPIVTLYPSSKWKYIIVHHSATGKGNALSLFRMHLRRGFFNGLGYHFVIDNDTYGKRDGQIETSPRWVHQDDGAHCKADSMNHRGIGICLVGNFSKDGVSAAQLESLVALVNTLRAYYHIPVENVIGHGQVRGAATECPGTRFPWAEFNARLRKER